MGKFQELVEKIGATPDEVLAVLLKIYKQKITKGEKGGGVLSQK